MTTGEAPDVGTSREDDDEREVMSGVSRLGPQQAERCSHILSTVEPLDADAGAASWLSFWRSWAKTSALV